MSLRAYESRVNGWTAAQRRVSSCTSHRTADLGDEDETGVRSVRATFRDLCQTHLIPHSNNLLALFRHLPRESAEANAESNPPERLSQPYCAPPTTVRIRLPVVCSHI